MMPFVSLYPQRRPDRIFTSPQAMFKLITLACFSGLLLVAWVFPMITDEAYYLSWARRSTFPDFGFFDHPPFVSWQAVLSRYGSSVFLARLGVLSLSVCTFYVNWRTAYLLTHRVNTAWTAALIALITIGGLGNSILLTPDSGLVFWWSLALHEGVAALKLNPKRWLTAGIATGCGLLSKYTMVLMGPVYLFALLREGRSQLRTPWPYLGGMVALLVFSPNLAWNAQHKWATINFQFGHGLSLRQSQFIDSSLPQAQEAADGSPSYQVYQDFQKALGGVTGFEETKVKAKPQKSRWERAWQYMGDYLGGIAALWGVLLFPLLGFLWKRLKIIGKHAPYSIPNAGTQLYGASALFPVLFFFALSPFTRIEANWPAMHMASGAFFLAKAWEPSWRKLAMYAGFHFFCVSLLLSMMYAPHLVPGMRNNRLLQEAAGYEQLSTLLERYLTKPLLAVDSYQLKSALAARSSTIMVAQWPGITRPSNYTMGHPDDRKIESLLLNEPEFELLTFEEFPPDLPGYEPVQLIGIRSCPDGSIAMYSVTKPVLPCVKGIRDWWLFRYKKHPSQ